MIVVEIPPHNSGKRNIVKLKPTSKLILFILILIAIFLTLNFFWPQKLAGYLQVSGSNTDMTVTEEITEDTILTTDIEIAEPELIIPAFKHTNYLTSALMIAIDARDVSFEDGEFVSHPTEFDKGSRNTDTIMQIVYDNTENRIFMISIPRDMGVDIVEDCMVHHGKINLVYDIAEKRDCPGGGEAMLNKAVADITGVDVHYYAYITLDAFKETIETFGTEDDNGKIGIELHNPQAFWEYYPKDTGGWQNIYFPEGDLFLDSNETLQYVRSRQYTSDFSRIRRQQTFIEAFKTAVSESNVLLNPQKLLHMVTVFNEESIITIPSLSEIRAGIELVGFYDEIDIYNIYLDPEFGGHEIYIDKQPNGRTGGVYYMTPTAWRQYPGNEFSEVRSLVKNIMVYPDAYNESPKIMTYGSSYLGGKPNLTNQAYTKFINNHFPITLTESTYLSQTDFDDEIIIFDFSDGKYQSTLDLLAKELNARVLPGGKAPQIQINQEDISIVINN